MSNSAAIPVTVDPRNTIRIRGAREHNLKNIDVVIPRDKLVVVTGLSGSGKSTLAFDTVFAEGQRKYMESLSTYARQFLDQLQKPELDDIEGLPPTIAIEQRGSSHNPRSTVATTTEIYDYLRVLFARAGTPHCWECGRKIESQSATQITDSVMKLPTGTKVMILSPLVRDQKGEHKEVFQALVKQGFIRARVDGNIIELNANAAGVVSGAPELKKTFKHTIEAVVDRIVIKPDIRSRVADSIETSLRLSQGLAIVCTQGSRDEETKRKRDEVDGPSSPRLSVSSSPDGWIDQLYSEKFACPEHPHVSLSELEPRLFSFNSPHGACPECHGLGTKLELDADLVIPNDTLSLGTGAVEAWRGMGKKSTIYYARVLRTFARDFGVDYDEPVKLFPKETLNALLHGTEAASTMITGKRRTRVETGGGMFFEGVIPHLKRRFESTESEWIKQRIMTFMSERPCPTCAGKRLRKEALAVRIESAQGDEGRGTRDEPEDAKSAATPKKKSKKSAADSSLDTRPSTLTLPGVSIDDVARMNVARAAEFFKSLKLSDEGKLIAEPIQREIGNRLGFLNDVGLGYLNLNRKTGSLSGGEAQRIRLATQVGSKLVGVCYVLDEPTIGLHQRDNTRLIRTLLKLRDLGNTVLMVEHDEDCIRAADHLIDIGPGAGSHGGNLVAHGPMPEVLQQNQSITVKYITGEIQIKTPETRRPVDPSKACVEIKGCTENNLKDVSVKFPLGGLVCVTGVSGSGKSTLVNQTLLPAMKRKVYNSKLRAGAHKALTGVDQIDKVIEIDQSPIGRTPRSNPATYTGVFDEIRKVFAKTKEAKLRGYEVGRFSFNVKGGRCEACQGAGTKVIEMHFLPDVFVECEVCKGARYNAETLEVKYRGKSISDILNMTVEESVGFFENFPAIHRMARALLDVGLGYVKLGQPSTQLSGGEAQRVKLAAELGKNPTGHTFYVLDEPTTGLHFADIQNLLNVLNRLADMGNTVLVIEHNLDVIKCADWLIDMGPEGGEAGGTVIAQGPPEKVAKATGSHTAEYLGPKLVS
jgi:excinuclease ABC subunit A